MSEINVRIDSTGGHSNIAIGLHELLIGWRGGRVVASIDVAISTGAVISQAASVRRMATDGIFAPHAALLRVDLGTAPDAYVTLTSAELRRLAESCDQMTERCLGIFAERSGHSVDELRPLVADHNSAECLNAKEALAWGFVDEITAPSGRPRTWTPHLWPKVKAAYERAGVPC